MSTPTSSESSAARDWPELTLGGWQKTRDTLHLWTQVVGKVRLGLEPMLNHWWQVPLYVSARGLTTSLMHTASFGVEIEFDFVDHVLKVLRSDGDLRELTLEARSVASFYAELTEVLHDLNIDVAINTRPVEVTHAVRFEEDFEHCAYDAPAVERLHGALMNAERVMRSFRAGFIGKASPVHLFWGAFDLAVSRFSGRPAPLHPGGVPNCPDWVQQLAYSHEVSSCGFWPGGDGEGAFYAYAYPTPEGFSAWPVEPAAAYFSDKLGEFQLPYREVRLADDPDAALFAFFQSTYEAAAELANWPRAALELRAPRAEWTPPPTDHDANSSARP